MTMTKIKINTEVEQKFTSAETSINKNRLPASTKKIEWEQYRGKKVLDVGGGKFDNLKDYLKGEYNIDLYVYDKFNRSEEENEQALSIKPSLVICNNVLNVISEDEVVEGLVGFIQGYGVDYVVSIYEGNRSGEGKASKKDCYQRNEKVGEYVKFFGEGAEVRKGMIVNKI